MKHIRLLTGLIAIMLISLSFQSDTQSEKNWPSWRGPYATGVAPLSDPPVTWSETENVKWKTAIPGKGFSTPIIWDDKVFVSTAIANEGEPESTNRPYTFKVLALNSNNGDIIWEKTMIQEEVNDRIHQTASHISNSPVTDGKYLYAYFGSRGLYCLDFEGNVIWKRDFGQMEKRSNFGEGSSPAIHGNRIVIQWDHEGQSEIFCMDKTTGKDIWNKKRDEPTSWSTPLLIEHDGRVQVIASATNKIRSYDLEDGEIIWECSGMTGNVIPHPVYNDGILYAMSGFGGNALLAIRIDGAEGDITGSDAVLWTYNQNTPYVPSPLLVNNRLYFLRSNNGFLTCIDVLSGSANYERESLTNLGAVYNSPVYASGRVYQMGGSGLTYVLKEGPSLEIISQNKLDDSFSASPAIAGDNLYLRGLKYLYCISED